MELGEKIQARRKELGLTLEEVGQKVGVGKSTVRKWEQGDIKNMGRDKIVALASALRTTPCFLMGWNTHEDEWTRRLRENVAFELENRDIADIKAAGIDIEQMKGIASGAAAVSLAEACHIADQLGLTVDELVNEKTVRDRITNGLDDEDRQLIAYLKEASHDEKAALLAFLKSRHANAGNE